ncbi:hypothetical protein [Deinococcus apachensis]|uniref:hypothetical protein n=1 Tax=Deinococcus apachensis TaxID=309886 RepID=UPI000382BCBD|nr:hypothetical protein [Deinococcus apachensis]
MAWVEVKLNRVKAGDTLRVNGGMPFVVQAIIGRRGFVLEVVTEDGVPVEIRDTDDVALLDP